MRARLEARYNLDAPISEQYFHLWNTVQLDFGPSFKLQDYTVNEVLAQGFPVSVALGILGDGICDYDRHDFGRHLGSSA